MGRALTQMAWKMSASIFLKSPRGEFGQIFCKPKNMRLGLDNTMPCLALIFFLGAIIKKSLKYLERPKRTLQTIKPQKTPGIVPTQLFLYVTTFCTTFLSIHCYLHNFLPALKYAHVSSVHYMVIIVHAHMQFILAHVQFV